MSAAIEPKSFAKIFFDGVSAVNSGSGRQFEDGLEYLTKMGNPEIIAEYRKLMPKDEESESDDEESDGMEEIVRNLRQAERNPRQAERPKMWKNAYIFYTLAIHNSIRVNNPEYNNVQIMEKMAKMWSALPEAERAPYVAQAAADKARYIAETTAFT